MILLWSLLLVCASPAHAQQLATPPYRYMGCYFDGSSGPRDLPTWFCSNGRALALFLSLAFPLSTMRTERVHQSAPESIRD